VGRHALTWKTQLEQGSAIYFLAGKNEGWFVMSASLFSFETLVRKYFLGVSGAGARAEMPCPIF